MISRVSIAIFTLLFATLVSAGREQEDAKTFGEQLHHKGYQNSEADLNQMKQHLIQQSGMENFEPHNAELNSAFESNYDSGKKGEDPLKDYFNQKTVENSKNKNPNQPSLGETQKFLKQRHRYKIAHDDPIFKKHEEISKQDLKDEEGIFQKGQTAQQPNPELKDRIVTCRIGSAGIERTCVKIRVINFTPPQVSSLSVVLAVRAYESVTFTVNFLQNAISAVNDMPTNTDYKHTNNSGINNKDGIIGWSGITQPLSNPSNIAQINFTSSDNGAAVVLQHPSPSNGYVGVLRFAPSGAYMNVLKAHLNWQVIGYPNLGQDTWKGCEELEVNDHFCEETFSEDQGINEARSIPGYPHPIIREYWSQAKSFHCGAGRDIDECQTLIEQKCEQIDSKCIQTNQGLCIEYENTFRCGVPDYQKGDGLTFNLGQVSFLKGHGQQSTGYEAGDFGEAVTHFNALTEMGKKLADELGGIMGDPNNPEVFRGKCSQCRVNLGSFFRDCCKLKGILQGLFGQCNEEEKKLAVAAVKNKRCVKVKGRYCHKKKLGVCTEERDSYCCYGSQLARIVQEITHEQLNIPWGDAEHPNCSGVTAEQLSQVDFTTLRAQQKLAEIMAEVQATAQEKFELVQNAVANMGNVQSKIDDLQRKQEEEFYKNPAVTEGLKVRVEDQRRRELIQEYEEIHGKSFPEYHDAWMDDISQIEKELHGGAAERQRKLEKIKEYQAMETELNALEDKLDIKNKSYGIPKAGTPDKELLNWFDNVVGEPGVDAHAEGIYKPRIKQYKEAIQRRLMLIKQGQEKEKQINLLEDELGTRNYSYTIPMEGTSEEELLNWINNIGKQNSFGGEEALIGHVDGTLETRLQKLKAQRKPVEMSSLEWAGSLAIAIEDKLKYIKELNNDIWPHHWNEETLQWVRQINPSTGKANFYNPNGAVDTLKYLIAEKQKVLAAQYWTEKEALLKKVSSEAGYDFESLINHYCTWNETKQMNHYVLNGEIVFPQSNSRETAIDIGILNFPQCHEAARAIHAKYAREKTHVQK